MWRRHGPGEINMSLECKSYEALGNIYWVADGTGVDPGEFPAVASRMCAEGGGDGLLLETSTSPSELSVRIFNPDGSEAEKSGNGVRIFARWLWDEGRVPLGMVQVSTKGGTVLCAPTVQDSILGELGAPTFDDRLIPFDRSNSGQPHRIRWRGREHSFVPVGMGNPHAVLLGSGWTGDDIDGLGPLMERDQRFPHRTNVQLAEVTSRTRARVLTWERGAGRTRSSGTSAGAVGSVLWKMGLAEAPLLIEMEGGTLRVDRTKTGHVTIEGPVSYVRSMSLM